MEAFLHTYGSLIGSVIAAAVGGIIAIRAIQTNRAIARLRATLDTIERTESQDHYKELTSTFRTFRRTPGSIEKVLAPQNDADREVRTAILFFLNHYELIAVGFQTDVLDKAFYAEFMRGSVVRDWNAAKPLIEAMRVENESQNPSPAKIFEYFEALAKEWEWEVRHEEYLRSIGRSEAQIKASIAWLRANPEAPRRQYP